MLAGNHLPEEAHILTYAINQALGANGKTVNYVELPSDDSSNISDLVEAIEADEIGTLIFLGGNPAFSSPANLDWSVLAQKVDLTIRIGSSIDETSELLQFAYWRIPTTWKAGATARLGIFPRTCQYNH